MKCDNCKKEFVAGNRGDGIPNGVGFQMKDGTVITLCAECIIELGKLNDKGRKEFFNKFGAKYEA